MFKNANEKATQRVTRLAKAKISNACHKNFVILSLLQKGDRAVCKAQATAKKSTEFKTRFKFMDTSLSCESSV